MANRGYKPGRHRVQCDRCGAAYLDDKVVTEWTGAVVCRGSGTRNCWEPRHSQDMVRARTDDSSVDNARPRNWETRGPHCTVSGISSISGYAVAGCSITGLEPSF